MTTPTPTETRPKNRGQFRTGPDPRGHRFTVEECQRGFWSAINSIILRYPSAIDSSGRHMAFGVLASRPSNNKEANQ